MTIRNATGAPRNWDMTRLSAHAHPYGRIDALRPLHVAGWDLDAPDLIPAGGMYQTNWTCPSSIYAKRGE